MSVVFTQRQSLGPNDLTVSFADGLGNPFDPYLVLYEFYGQDHTRGTWKVGLGDRTPAQDESGTYYVSETLSTGFIPGDYYIQWIIKRTENSPLEIAKKQEFAFVGV